MTVAMSTLSLQICHCRHTPKSERLFKLASSLGMDGYSLNGRRQEKETGEPFI